MQFAGMRSMYKPGAQNGPPGLLKAMSHTPRVSFDKDDDENKRSASHETRRARGDHIYKMPWPGEDTDETSENTGKKRSASHRSVARNDANQPKIPFLEKDANAPPSREYTTKMKAPKSARGSVSMCPRQSIASLSGVRSELLLMPMPTQPQVENLFSDEDSEAAPDSPSDVFNRARQPVPLELSDPEEQRSNSSGGSQRNRDDWSGESLEPYSGQQEHHFKYVIVGGGTAGGYAAREFVRLGCPAGQVLLISGEDVCPYERGVLSKGFLLGKAKLPGFHTCAAEDGPHTMNWYNEHGITVFLGCMVVEADLIQNHLVTNTRGQVYFGQVLFCTGAAPLRLELPGAEEADNICYLRNIKDSQKILDKLSPYPCAQVAIVGGGYLAMESASHLTELGHNCTMLFPSQTVMSRLWPNNIAKHYQDFYRAKGVKFLPFSNVAAFQTNDARQVSAVKLHTGQEVQCKLVIVCIGSTIPTHLFEHQLELQGRGVKVNGYMQTSLESVYCIGDLASFYLPRLGRYEVMEHVNHARRSAEHAVRHVMGVQGLANYDYHPYFYSRIFNLSWQFWGDPQGQVFLGCGHEDSIPGERLTLAAVWVTSTGRVNGIMLESCSSEEQELAHDVVKVRKAVPITLFQNVKSKDHLIQVLRSAAPVEEGEGEDEQPCKLSKSEISRMIQKLPPEDAAFLSSEEFAKKGKELFFAEAPSEYRVLAGKPLRDAICKLLPPQQANIVYAAMESAEQIKKLTQNFGGAPAMDGNVKDQDFVPFIQFCVAWCVWCGFEVSNKTEVSAITKHIQKHQVQLIEELENRCQALGLNEIRLIGKVVRKIFKELADFLWEHINTTVEQVEGKLLEKQKSMKEQLAQSNKREEELRQAMKDQETAHGKEVSRVKQCFESTATPGNMMQLELLEKSKALENSQASERKLTQELQKVQRELANLQKLTSGKRTDSKEASGHGSAKEDALRAELAQKNNELEDARLQLQTIWDTAVKTGSRRESKENSSAARHASKDKPGEDKPDQDIVFAYASAQSELNRFRRENMDLRKHCAVLTHSLSEEEEKNVELEMKVDQLEKDLERDTARQKLLKGFKASQKSHKYDKCTLRKWFIRMDSQANGKISKDEFVSFLRQNPQLRTMMLGELTDATSNKICEKLSPRSALRSREALGVKRMIKLFKQIDKHSTGYLDFEQFLEFFRSSGFLLDYSNTNNPRSHEEEIIVKEHERRASQIRGGEELDGEDIANSVRWARRKSEEKWAIEEATSILNAGSKLIENKKKEDTPTAILSSQLYARRKSEEVQKASRSLLCSPIPNEIPRPRSSQQLGQ